MKYTHQTKHGFGRLLKAGINCNIISESNGKCTIQVENGAVFHGLKQDLLCLN